MERYVVTGGAGFIGSHIAERLLREGKEVCILDDLSTGRSENLDALRALRLPGRLDWLQGDIRSKDDCLRACKGASVVFHQAALASVQRSIEMPAETTDVNVVGTVTVFSAAKERGVRRVVSASSSSVYGNAPSLPKHEGMPTLPLSPYAASKLALEQFARVWSESLGLETVSLRYFNVFGPRQDPNSQYSAVIPLFISALLAGKRPTIFGTGEQSRDFTYIDNVVEANLAAARCPNPGGAAVNIACGDRFSLLTLLDSLGSILGVQLQPEFRPARVGDVLHSQASVEEAKRILGFTPAVDFEDGLRKTVEYFRRAP
jgi:nucleoside-diphosphate-sugar epimerase